MASQHINNGGSCSWHTHKLDELFIFWPNPPSTRTHTDIHPLANAHALMYLDTCSPQATTKTSTFYKSTAGSWIHIPENNFLSCVFLVTLDFSSRNKCIPLYSTSCACYLKALCFSFSLQSLELLDLSHYRCWGWFSSLGWCTDNSLLPREPM